MFDQEKNRQQCIVDALSAEIMSLAQQCGNEQRMPVRTADEMDDFIKDCKLKINRLRSIRVELELIFTGMVP